MTLPPTLVFELELERKSCPAAYRLCCTHSFVVVFVDVVVAGIKMQWTLCCFVVLFLYIRFHFTGEDIFCYIFSIFVLKEHIQQQQQQQEQLNKTTLLLLFLFFLFLIWCFFFTHRLLTFSRIITTNHPIIDSGYGNAGQAGLGVVAYNLYVCKCDFIAYFIRNTYILL